MKYVCDAPDGKTWFRLETEGEATTESAAMEHAVEKHFRIARDKANQSYEPPSSRFIEQEIGRKAHLDRSMPLFLTLRTGDGAALATAMLPPGGHEDASFRSMVVGHHNSDPYPDHGPAIEALAAHVGFALPRDKCYPYRS